MSGVAVTRESRGRVGGRLRALAYRASGSRDHRIDLLRGFAVFAMVVDHIGGASWLYALTGGNQFAVSAAEGFVFLSGLLVGIVYRKIVESKGLLAGIRKALGRALQLYLLTIVLAVGFGIAATLSGMAWGDDVVTDPIQFALQLATLQRTYYLADVLLLYALLLAITPLALLALRYQRWPIVLGASVGLWLAYQISPVYIEVPWAIERNETFRLAPWQIIFFSALLLGWYRKSFGARLAAWLLRPWVILASVTAATGLIGLWLADPVALSDLLGQDGSVQLWALFDKPDVAPGRLVAAVVFFHLAYVLSTLVWRPLRAALGWFLLPFGERTLSAYSTHLFLVVGVGVVTGLIPGFDPADPALNTLAQLGVVATLWASLLVAPPLLARADRLVRSTTSALHLAPPRPVPLRLGAAGLPALLVVGLLAAGCAAVNRPGAGFALGAPKPSRGPSNGVVEPAAIPLAADFADDDRVVAADD